MHVQLRLCYSSVIYLCLYPPISIYEHMYETFRKYVHIRFKYNFLELHYTI